MKVLAVILVSMALANGKGSGPYLPSGWRPDGPAFFLPSEIVKPPPSTQDLGSEASGSDFLREYGPPKVQDISQNLLSQGLPGVTIEQDFAVSARNAGSSQVVAEEVAEVSEAKPQEVVSTELPTTAAISVKLPILDFEVKEPTTTNIEQATERITASNQQVFQETNVQSNLQNSQASLQYTNEQNSGSQTTELSAQNQQSSESATVQTNQQESTQSLENQQESSTVSSLGVAAIVDSAGNTEKKLNAVPAIYEQNAPELQNIPDILASLEKEILTEQVELKQAVGEVGSVPVPEGFLEYGPPGFAEYGPPKEDQIQPANLRAIETNETRRRRLSPRFRLGRQ